MSKVSSSARVSLIVLLVAASALAASRDTPGQRGTSRPTDGATLPQAPSDGSEAAVAAGGELQRAIFAARDAVLPALVHVEPIIDVYRRGQKEKAAITGSGVIVSRDGLVLTNNHVVANAQRVTCTLYDKREVMARVVGRDPLTDVAVIQLELDGQSVPVARLGSSKDLTAGQHVMALGSPLGLARSLSLGVVSTPDRYLPEEVLPTGEVTGSYNTWIQTDAAINPGNSGGPLVDLAGRVVGINARAIPIFGENIGFAIPIDVVRDVSTQLVRDGRVSRSWIGARWQHLKSLAQYFGASDRGGVLVGGLVPGGPAERAGLEPGDVLLAWMGQPISIRFEEELPRFDKMVADTAIGTRVPMKLLRRGQELSLDVVTEARPDTESAEVELDGWGLTAKDITADLARQARLKSLEGAYITGVKPAAPAAVSGLRDGDIVREIEGRTVRNTVDLLAAFRELTASKTRKVLVKVDRGSTIRLAVLEPSS